MPRQARLESPGMLHHVIVRISAILWGLNPWQQDLQKTSRKPVKGFFREPSAVKCEDSRVKGSGAAACR